MSDKPVTNASPELDPNRCPDPQKTDSFDPMQKLADVFEVDVAIPQILDVY